jgi:hypothetical protein
MEDIVDGYTYYRFLTGMKYLYFLLPGAYSKDASSFFLSSEGTIRLEKNPWTEEVVVQRITGIVAVKYLNSSKCV